MWILLSVKSLHIFREDVVCGYLPNTYETAVFMFAAAAIGAAWTAASVDFGPQGVLDRFKQVRTFRFRDFLSLSLFFPLPLFFLFL